MKTLLKNIFYCCFICVKAQNSLLIHLVIFLETKEFVDYSNFNYFFSLWPKLLFFQLIENMAERYLITINQNFIIAFSTKCVTA